MLFRFKSRATADLILLEPQAQRLLQIIGKEATPQGIVTLAQMPGAIAALQAAVADEARREAEAPEGLPDPDAVPDPDAPERDTVRLRQRAAPFIELLRRSAAVGKDVVWGV